MVSLCSGLWKLSETSVLAEKEGGKQAGGVRKTGKQVLLMRPSLVERPAGVRTEFFTPFAFSNKEFFAMFAESAVLLPTKQQKIKEHS